VNFLEAIKLQELVQLLAGPTDTTCVGLVSMFTPNLSTNQGFGVHGANLGWPKNKKWFLVVWVSR
jgi:hypothetical protein